MHKIMLLWIVCMITIVCNVLMQKIRPDNKIYSIYTILVLATLATYLLVN